MSTTTRTNAGSGQDHRDRRRITVGDQVLGDVREPRTQQVLAQAHQGHVRPVCHCTRDGVALYVARAGSGFIIKRMPDTGAVHAPTCESYAPPEALSGLGQVLGEAITEGEDRTLLRLGFSLAKQDGAGGGVESGGSEPSDTVSADPARLSLRAVLHYLWQEAELSVWSPRMAGKRNWRVVSWHTRTAARGKFAKRRALSDVLFVPEPFEAAKKAQIAARRIEAWKAVASTGGRGRQLMICVGELKGIEPARFGHALVLKHLPDAPLRIEDELLGKFTKRFETELEMWQEDSAGHLMVICTCSVGRGGSAKVEELSVMMTDEHWLPYDGAVGRLLIDTLIEQQRRFTVQLRYNLAAQVPIATVVLTDTEPATAMFVVTDTDDDITHTLQELTDDTGTTTWVWKVTEAMPDIPPAARHAGQGEPRRDTHTTAQNESHHDRSTR